MIKLSISFANLIPHYISTKRKLSNNTDNIDYFGAIMKLYE